MTTIIHPESRQPHNEAAIRSAAFHRLKQVDSRKAASELLDADKALDAAGKAHAYAGMEKGVENVHTMYQALEFLFA